MKKVELSLLALMNNKNIISKLNDIRNAGVEYIHYDVMDGIFVSNKAFDGEYINDIKNIGFKISVHLMVKNISKYIDKFIDMNIDILTFHVETQSDEEIIRQLLKIKEKGIKAGIAIKPYTKISDVEKFSKYIDVITIMSVEPGKGGQKFIPETFYKLIDLKNNSLFKDVIVQIDGGINNLNIFEIKKYVNLIVSGSYLANCQNIKELINKIEE